MNTFNERSQMFVDYLVHDFFQLMVVHELALVHDRLWTTRVHEQSESSWTELVDHLMKVLFVVHSLKNVHSFLFTNIY